MQTLKPTSLYTIERIHTIDQMDVEFTNFFVHEARAIAKMYGNKFKWTNFDMLGYAREGLVLVVRRRGVPVGAVFARLYGSIFDPEVKILMQDILYVKDGFPIATCLLMQGFIAFGREYANHCFTMLTEQTNIKPSSLKKLGFKEVETLYRLEV